MSKDGMDLGLMDVGCRCETGERRGRDVDVNMMRWVMMNRDMMFMDGIIWQYLLNEKMNDEAISENQDIFE